MLTDEVIAELEAKIVAAERLVAGDKRRERILSEFAKPMRRTFTTARAYHAIKVVDVEIGSEPTRLPDFKKAYLDDGTKVVNPDARMSWDEKGLKLSIVSPAPYKLGKDIWDSDCIELFLATGDSKPLNLYQFAVAANLRISILPLIRLVRARWTGKLWVWSPMSSAAISNGGSTSSCRGRRFMTVRLRRAMSGA